MHLNILYSYYTYLFSFVFNFSMPVIQSMSSLEVCFIGSNNSRISIIPITALKMWFTFKKCKFYHVKAQRKG